MKTLIIGDTHINEKFISELDIIFKEILKIKADRLIHLGDFYDNKRPTAKEILFGTEWLTKFREKYKEIILIRGNHDKTRNISAIDYLKYLHAKVMDEYIDENNNYYSHFMTDKSKLEYGTAYKTVKQLLKYNKVFLGHQHLFQEIKKNKMYHIGSCRFCNFNEVEDKTKVIASLDEANNLTFASLKSPMPMIEVKSIKELANIKPGKKNVRLIISSFEQFKKEVNEFDKYRHLYFEFKTKLEFNQQKQTPNIDKGSVTTSKRRLEEILEKGIKEIKDDDIRKILKEIYNEM